MFSDLHRLGMNHVESQGPNRSGPSRAPNTSSAPTSGSSITRTRSRAKFKMDVNPDNSPHGTTSKPKVKRRPSPIPSRLCSPPKQKPVERGVGGSATAPIKRAGGTGCANDDPRFLEAVSIGESLERDLEAFLPLLESVPPLFRSRGYYRRKTEFLNVKGILTVTVRTLKARQRGDIRKIAQQYLSFKHMIYDNLRSLLLWLDSEMETHKEARRKESYDLPARTSSDAQAPPSPQSQPQPQPVCQSTEIVDSPIIGQLSGPSKRSDKRRSVFSEVASSLAQILNSPLDIEMPSPVGGAANFLIVDGVLKYASLQALIAILTNSKPNPNIRHLDQLHDTFLLCFRCFSTPADVGNALTARYRQPQPENLTEEQENAWPFHLQAIRLRVMDVLRAWVDSYWVYEDDRQAAPLIQHFLESTTELRWSEASKKIAQSLRRHFLIPNHPNMCRDTRHLQAINGAALKVRFAEHRKDSVGLLETYAVKRLRGSSGQNALNSANLADGLVRNEDVAHVLVFDSKQHCTELARQLTLFMSTEFRKLDPEKLWHHTRRRCEDCDTEQTVKILQLHALALQVWTARTVVEQDDPDTRAGILIFFVALAFRLRKLRNFSALCAIYSGLTSGFMEKLSQESLPLTESTKSALQDLCQLVQEARSDHESAIDCRNPTVPPIEWFLEDLRSVSRRQRHAPAPGMPKNALNIESYYEVPQIVRNMEKCHIPYASVVRTSRVQAWISKSLFKVSERDLGEGRAWVELRCDAIERKGPPQPKLFAQCLPLPLIRKQTSFIRTCTEITHLVPELLPSAPDPS